MRHFIFYDSPLGQMLLMANADALTGLYFIGQKYYPSIDVTWRQDPQHRMLRRAALQLDEYFAGERTHFDVPLGPIGTVFQRAVWQAICSVRHGETIAYAALAQRAGRRNSVRAAAAATGRNPISIIIPCHRIVGSDNSLTGYAGGLDKKRALLGLEAQSQRLFMSAA